MGNLEYEMSALINVGARWGSELKELNEDSLKIAPYNTKRNRGIPLWSE